MDKLILYSTPVFLLSIALEWMHTKRQDRDIYESRDASASLAMGAGSGLVGLPFQVLFLWIMSLVYEFRLVDLTWSPWVAVGLLVGEDFCYYWSHRMNHEVRILWAGHVVHHSSQRYHLATALRQSWTQPFMMWIWWLPLPLLGFKPEWIAAQMALNLIYQFFVHTQEVGKLGPLEWVLNTPSHHRVHHAVNPRYLDRNHGGIFIVWDRLFGTFVEEREDDTPVYGITKNIRTFNPLRISFHEWAAMFRDVAQAPWSKKLQYVFAPPGYSHDGSRQTSAQIRATVGDRGERHHDDAAERG